MNIIAQNLEEVPKKLFRSKFFFPFSQKLIFPSQGTLIYEHDMTSLSGVLNILLGLTFWNTLIS